MLSTVASGTGSGESPEATRGNPERAVTGRSMVSTSDCQVPQPGQRPYPVGYCPPHCWQTYLVCDLGISPPLRRRSAPVSELPPLSVRCRLRLVQPRWWIRARTCPEAFLPPMGPPPDSGSCGVADGRH